jgi:hypothetical protein
MNKYDTLKYSPVKAITVSVCLRNFLCALTITNKLSGAIARDAIGVKILTMILMSINLVYH